MTLRELAEKDVWNRAESHEAHDRLREAFQLAKREVPAPIEPATEEKWIAKFISDWQWESGDGPDLWHGDYQMQRVALHKFASALYRALIKVGTHE